MRVEKEQLATYVTGLIEESEFLFFITYKGLDVFQFGEFRDQLASVGSNCHVLKNSFIDLGLRNNKITIPDDLRLAGDTAVVFGGGDPTVAAKVIFDFGKNLDFVTFKSGLINGTLLPASEAAEIAKLPPREVLLSQLLGVLQAPMSNLVGVLNAKLLSIVYVLQSYRDTKEQSS